MKKFDRYSIRGIIFSVLGFAGIGYELLSSRSREAFVILMYGFDVLMGVLLIFLIHEHKD